MNLPVLGKQTQGLFKSSLSEQDPDLPAKGEMLLPEAGGPVIGRAITESVLSGPLDPLPERGGLLGRGLHPAFNLPVETGA